MLRSWNERSLRAHILIHQLDRETVAVLWDRWQHAQVIVVNEQRDADERARDEESKKRNYEIQNNRCSRCRRKFSKQD